MSVWRNTTDNYFRGSKDDAFQVLIDIASALGCLHSRQLDRHDIKPGNILLSNERGAVVCDFSHICRTRAMSGGTPWYIPPEYITVSRRGQPGDVFALGVTMLYLRKLLPLPDVAGRGFVIADIHSRRTELQQAARNKKASWLAEVEAARTQLELSTEAFIIRDMLSLKGVDRPTTAELVKRLSDELYRRNHRPQVKQKISDRAARERGGEGHKNKLTMALLQKRTSRLNGFKESWAVALKKKYVRPSNYPHSTLRFAQYSEAPPLSSKLKSYIRNTNAGPIQALGQLFY